MSPHVVLALRANAALRGLGGFLTIFAAFLVQATFPGGWEATLALGALAAAAGRGQLRRHRRRLAAARRRPRPAGAATRPRPPPPSPCWRRSSTASPMAAVVVLVSAVTNALGKVVPRRDHPARGAREPAGLGVRPVGDLLQLAWVVGGAFGIALPPTGWLGFTVAAALLVLAVGLIVWSLYRGGRRGRRRARRSPPTRRRPPWGRSGREQVRRCPAARRSWPAAASGEAAGPENVAGRRSAPRRSPSGPTQYCLDGDGQRYTNTPPIIEVSPDTTITLTVPDSVAEQGWSVQVFDEKLEEHARRGRRRPRATAVFDEINTSDVVPPAFYLVVVEDKGGDCGGFSGAWPVGFLRAGGDLERDAVQQRPARLEPPQPSRSAATARSTDATLRDSARSGCRPRRSPSPTSSSSLIRSSMIGTSSSGFFRLAARRAWPPPTAAGRGCAPAAPGRHGGRRRCRTPRAGRA